MEVKNRGCDSWVCVFSQALCASSGLGGLLTYGATLSTSSTAPSQPEKEDSLPNTAPSAACVGSEGRTPHTWGNAT
eukprot:scaffold19937_cov127-Isochrysis_galbana.AAC.1